MTEPDDRPGSDDPEDPSELLRLIGRTVPRSPHAAGPAPDPHPAGTGEGVDATPDPASPHPEPAPTTPAADRASRTGGTDHAPATPGAVPDPARDPIPGPDVDRSARSGPAGGGNVPIDDGTPSAPPEEEPEDEQEDGPDEPPFDELADDTELEHALEALLLVVDAPVDEPSLATALHQTPSRIRQTLHRMSLAYTADRRGIDLRRAGEGWRFYTRDRYAPYVEKMLMDGQRARLTRAALETLAVVAYRQPVTRARVSAVRGVNCDGVLRTLLTRGLVEEAGTEEHTGGTLFRTTELFLERLGISSVAELPPLAPLLPDIDAIDDLEH